MKLYSILKSELGRRGITFVEEYGAFQMTMRSGTMKWRCLLTASGDDIICCAQFPWRAGTGTAKKLNDLNLTLNTGCFMVDKGYVILRCGMEINDPMECGEIAAMLLRRCGKEVCRCWNSVYLAAEVTDEL